MRSTLLGLILGLVGLAGIYWFMYGNEDADALLQGTPSPLSPPATEEARAEAPEILHPLTESDVEDEEDATEEGESLPSLEDSDSIAVAEMRELFGAASVDSLLVPKDVVRRFVLTVDSLDREPLPLWLRPVRRVPGLFLVDREPIETDASGEPSEVVPGRERITASPENQRRYAPLMKMVDYVDPAAFATVYKRYYPLIQDSYDQLGNPDSRYFNDRFVEIIDHLLETPEIEGPIELIQPKVLYKFADPDLERRSHGQKALLRIGPSNASQVKAKLRELRSLITTG